MDAQGVDEQTAHEAGRLVASLIGAQPQSGAGLLKLELLLKDVDAAIVADIWVVFEGSAIAYCVPARNAWRISV